MTAKIILDDVGRVSTGGDLGSRFGLIRLGERLADARAELLVLAHSDSYDKSQLETINGSYRFG